MHLADAFINFVCVGIVFCCGGLSGLIMAWSQPSRMRHWARMVDLNADRVNLIRAEIDLDRFESRRSKIALVEDAS